ncbi:hypothetical protein ACFWD7_47475 [Streptomyces mirabilis]|uniref:hypothetical protein n=1 Tax=Streptomyces mirabilis TaxID=68239 RepID=UPI0021C05030|nr:hypothetical protein [Streptomyces mirabilis]MCT9113678.1 hypothetical protein [Streptomyces mirabilis]
MIQRLEKVLQDAGTKLTSVASQAYSKSARAILDVLVEGERDPKVLASLVKGRLRSTRERLEEALGHRFRVEHRVVLARRLLAAKIGLDMSEIRDVSGDKEAVVLDRNRAVKWVARPGAPEGAAPGDHSRIPQPVPC